MRCLEERREPALACDRSVYRGTDRETECGGGVEVGERWVNTHPGLGTGGLSIFQFS